MSIITTFNSYAQRATTPANAAYGIALAGGTIVYATSKTSLRFTFFLRNEPIHTDKTLVELAVANNALPFTATSEIAFVESSYKAIIVVGVRASSAADITAYFIDTVTYNLIRTVNLNTPSFDKINRQDRVLTMISGNEARIFSDAWSNVFRISGIETCTTISKTVYFTLAADKSKLCKDDLGNLQSHPLSTTYTAPSVLINNDEDIKFVITNLTSSKIIVVSASNYRVYDISTNLLIDSTPNNTVLANTTTMRSDMHGHILYNSSTAHIFDTLFISSITADALDNVTFTELQQTKHVQAVNNSIVLQTDSAIIFLTDVKQSIQTSSISVTNAPLTASISGIDHGRLIEYVLPIGSHKIEIKCLDNSNWQDNFDLSFFVDIGFDRRLDALSDAAKINCRLNLIVNGVPTAIVVNLSTILRSSDILSTKYNMLDYRINDEQSLTLRQYVQDKALRFDVSKNNIVFEISVKSEARAVRASSVHFHILKIFRYADSSKLLITN